MCRSGEVYWCERQGRGDMEGVVFKIDLASYVQTGVQYVEGKAFHVKPGKRKPWLYRPVDPTWNLIKKLWRLHGPGPLNVGTLDRGVWPLVGGIVPEG